MIADRLQAFHTHEGALIAAGEGSWSIYIDSYKRRREVCGSGKRRGRGAHQPTNTRKLYPTEAPTLLRHQSDASSRVSRIHSPDAGECHA